MLKKIPYFRKVFRVLRKYVGTCALEDSLPCLYDVDTFNKAPVANAVKLRLQITIINCVMLELTFYMLFGYDSYT